MGFDEHDLLKNSCFETIHLHNRLKKNDQRDNAQRNFLLTGKDLPF